MSAVLTPPRTTPALLTAEEFMLRYGHHSGVELVNGIVVYDAPRPETESSEARMPNFRHGVYCRRVARILEDFAIPRSLGWIATNDSFVKVSDGTVRGADVLFVSYSRVPLGDGVPPEHLVVPPELVFEVRSPSDRISTITAKAADYLACGVGVVVVLDPKLKSATVFRESDFAFSVRGEDKLDLSDVLPGFEVAVAKFFE